MTETLLAGIGISAAAGLNVLLPLLVLALADKVSDTGLDSRFDALSSVISLIAILLLLPIELLADKTPRLSRYVVEARQFLGPVAGGLGFMAINSIHHELPTIVAGVFGFAIAAVVARLKAVGRTTLMQRGKAASLPVVSMLEDVAVLAICIVSALAPYGNLVAVPLWAWVLWLVYRRFLRENTPQVVLPAA